MIDLRRTWMDQLLNRRLSPYCRERGIPTSVPVGSRFAQEQLGSSLDPTTGRLVLIQLVERGRAATRERPTA
jgi:hypothetical protein